MVDVSALLLCLKNSYGACERTMVGGMWGLDEVLNKELESLLGTF